MLDNKLIQGQLMLNLSLIVIDKLNINPFLVSFNIKL